jgi:hypothetical protein
MPNLSIQKETAAAAAQSSVLVQMCARTRRRRRRAVLLNAPMIEASTDWWSHCAHLTIDGHVLRWDLPAPHAVGQAHICAVTAEMQLPALDAHSRKRTRRRKGYSSVHD